MELPTGRTILTPVAPDKTMNVEKGKGVRNCETQKEK
jgi:hypothetical protein